MFLGCFICFCFCFICGVFFWLVLFACVLASLFGGLLVLHLLSLVVVVLVWMSVVCFVIESAPSGFSGSTLR